MELSELLEFSIINVDKPAGMTSHDVVYKIKKIVGARKAGHFGTLDPMVTGVLPVAINRACRLSNFLMKKDKEYVGKMKIHSEISEDKLREEMEKFVGKIMQRPPVKSRVKRVLREREISKFELLSYDPESKIAEFHSDVEAGTYIRKLISDLGERIGGAHMVGLRRIRAGYFNEKDSFTLEEIREAFEKEDNDKIKGMLIYGDIVGEIIGKVNVSEDLVEGLLNGKKLEIASNEDMICVFSEGKFIGIYGREGEIFKPEFVLN